MDLGFWPQRNDALDYLRFGIDCAKNGPCWNSLRPLGIVYYMSLPLRWGFPADFIVRMNLCMVAFSALLMALAMGALFPESTRNRAAFFWRWAAVIGIHCVFAVPDSHVALSDVPAACLGLMGLSLFIMGSEWRKKPLLAIAGAFLGLAAIFRTEYLYPDYVFLACCLLAYRIRPAGSILTRNTLIVFALLLLAPLTLQYWATFKHTGVWSFIAPTDTASLLQAHLGRPNYGMDTLISGEPVYYVYRTGYLGAWYAHDYLGLLVFFLKHQIFYFSSFCHVTYLYAATEHVFSLWVLMLNMAAGIATLHSLAGRKRVTSARILVLLYILAVWGVASLSESETRFVMLINLLSWSIAASLFITWAFKARPAANIPLVPVSPVPQTIGHP